MPHASEPATSPGFVRRLWWRSDQRARLAIACAGVLGVLAVTGAAGFSGAAPPGQRSGPAAAAAVHRGDSFEVTVRTVSDVDSFEGVEPDTGRAFGARVYGVNRAACWQSQSLAAAENLLRGKKVRLTVKSESEGDAESGRLLVDVQLPDGSDYARTIVAEGSTSADLAARGDLVPEEMAARQQRRGLWSTGCERYEVDPVVTTSSVPPTSSTTTPVPTTTTTNALPPPPPVRPTKKPAPEPPPTETTEPDDDAEWLSRFVGKRCVVEGATRTSPKGTEVVCARDARGQLRWQRAD